MTPRQVHQVQASFIKVVPIANRAAALFYARLFETAPETGALFRGNMDLQGRKLMSALATIVNSLGDFATIVPVARLLAKHHVACGVRPEHYSLVGSALLWTLEQELANEFTPALRAAREAAYCALSEVMIAAAYRRRSKLPALAGLAPGCRQRFAQSSPSDLAGSSRVAKFAILPESAQQSEALRSLGPAGMRAIAEATLRHNASKGAVETCLFQSGTVFECLWRKLRR